MGVALKKGDFDMGNRRYSEMGFFEIYFTVCGKTEHEFEFGLSIFLGQPGEGGGAQKNNHPVSPHKYPPPPLFMGFNCFPKHLPHSDSPFSAHITLKRGRKSLVPRP